MTARSFHPFVEVSLTWRSDIVTFSWRFTFPASNLGKFLLVCKLIPTGQPNWLQKLYYIVFQGLQINSTSCCGWGWILDCSKYAFDLQQIKILIRSCSAGHSWDVTSLSPGGGYQVNRAATNNFNVKSVRF